MKLIQNCSILAVIVALSNAASLPTSLRSKEIHQISTVEDIPELRKGFTWRILKRPVGNDTRIGRVVETDAEPNQLKSGNWALVALAMLGHPL
ncbi:hypothetical protein EYZ11_006774 [Aspergillus tanneri]|uniref:Uncharacterized protein n=1 Tax=Aspergillus tanneri TaxID=1220188 RepID=A0A4V3UP53_9EURO|nr:hypothetical protein EYZ11_006774 [Aspergillus tanneri]